MNSMGTTKIITAVGQDADAVAASGGRDNDFRHGKRPVYARRRGGRALRLPAASSQRTQAVSPRRAHPTRNPRDNHDFGWETPRMEPAGQVRGRSRRPRAPADQPRLTDHRHDIGRGARAVRHRRRNHGDGPITITAGGVLSTSSWPRRRYVEADGQGSQINLDLLTTVMIGVAHGLFATGGGTISTTNAASSVATTTCRPLCDRRCRRSSPRTAL